MVLGFFDETVEELDASLHGKVEVIGDVVIVSAVFVKFHVLVSLKHLVEKIFREFKWNFLVSCTVM